MITNYNLENPYDLVESNNWTFDKFEEMSINVASDTNNDGIMTAAENGDCWGISSTHAVYTALQIAAGEKFFAKDADDIPYYNMTNERFSTVYLRIFDILNRRHTYMQPGSTSYYGHGTVFCDENALFLVEGVYSLRTEDILSTEVNYGVVPMPKYDSDQSRYYTYVNLQSHLMCIPITAPDLERTGLITQALAKASTGTVREAYYEKVLKCRGTRDEDAYNMMDIIYDSRYYELGFIYNWADIRLKFQELGFNGSNAIASFTEQYKLGAQIAIKKIIDQMEN